MSGSFVDSGAVCARVEHVGADNYVARINNEAKYVKKVNSEIMRALDSIVRFASAIMLPLGIALFLSSAYESYAAAGTRQSVIAWLLSGDAAWSDVSAAILSTVGALLGMIPQGLVLLTSSVLAIATFRLARRRVLAQQLYCIETLARVDVLCLDKTGTITSGRMEVAGAYALDADGRAVPLEDADAACAREVDFALCGDRPRDRRGRQRDVPRAAVPLLRAPLRAGRGAHGRAVLVLQEMERGHVRAGLLRHGRRAVRPGARPLRADLRRRGRARRHLPRARGRPRPGLHRGRVDGVRGRAAGARRRSATRSARRPPRPCATSRTRASP